ncbi:MAG: hypothetical protein ABIJ34_08445 [archaeon]
MGFFDKFNPFKKDEGPVLPFDTNPAPSQEHNYGIGEHNFEPHNFDTPPQANNPNMGNDIFTPSPTEHGAQDDPRMRMPLGESVKLGKYGNEQVDEYSGNSQQESKNPLQKDLDLISSKLDYLKASLEAINQRLVNLEHIVKQEQQNRKW